MQLWKNINTIVDSLTQAIVSTARTTEKIVVLAENEVDALTVEQKLRIEKDLKEFEKELNQ